MHEKLWSLENRQNTYRTLDNLWDMDNLWDWGMSSYLLYCGFKWLKTVENFDVNSISKKSSTNNILEVDLNILKSTLST